MCDKKKVLGKLKTDRDPWDCFVTSVVSNQSVVGIVSFRIPGITWTVIKFLFKCCLTELLLDIKHLQYVYLSIRFCSATVGSSSTHVDYPDI